ncbi:MAG TPA: helix-turn-helix transcriptional regulator [Caulobacteraceae bacterium]
MSNRIQELRESRGLTLRDVATKIGTSNQQISHLELGKRHLTVEWMVRLATVLECHPWELVEAVQPPALTQREARMLKNFRGLAIESQDALIADTKQAPGAGGPRKRRPGQEGLA